MGFVSSALATDLPAVNRENWPRRVLLATAATGSTYFTLGAGMAHRLSERLQLPISVETTGGSAQNAALVQNGDIDVGFVALPLAWDAWRGQSRLAPGLRHERLRALFPLYPTPLVLAIPPHRAVTQLADLRGQTIGLGAQGGPADSYWSLVFEALNLPIQARYNARPTQRQQWQQGELAALGLTLNATRLEELHSDWGESGVQWLAPASAEQQRLLLERMFSPWVLTSGLLTPQQPELRTVALWHFAVARNSLPNDLVYEWLNLAINDEQILSLQPSLSILNNEAIQENRAIPYHAGAARFYVEQGITLPPDWSAL